MRKSFYIGYKGRLEAYIYIWFSKEYKLVYVGETNNRNGVIGRADQHISRGDGTLFQRVYEKGYDLEEINDFVLLSYPLPREKKYLSEETSYRISIEYLVQKGLYKNRINSTAPYNLVSQVTTGPYIELKSIQDIAELIINDFCEIYEQA